MFVFHVKHGVRGGARRSGGKGAYIMPRYGTQDIPNSALEVVAKRALQRPSNFIRYDEATFDTHGLVFSWADRGDDLFAESNYHVMLAELRTVIENGEATNEDLIEGSESHWAVGHLSTLYVRVYEEPAPGCSWSEYTRIFKVAAAMVLALDDYPLLDDDDHSERESAAWDAVVEDALDSAQRDHPEDSPAERIMFEVLLTEGTRGDLWPDLYELFSHGDCSPDSVDWEAVQTAYDEVRDAHFEWLARWHAYSPLVGQLAAF